MLTGRRYQKTSSPLAEGCTSGMKEDPSCPLISSQKLPKTSKSSQNTYKRPFLHSKLGWELKRSLACHKNHHVACFRFVPLMTSSSILNEFEWMVLLENLPSLVFCYKKESIDDMISILGTLLALYL
jgi:hypothetical protein